jgi:hypothetical protein
MIRRKALPPSSRKRSKQTRTTKKSCSVCLLLLAGFFLVLFFDPPKMDAVHFSETSLDFYWTTERYIPEERNLQINSVEPGTFVILYGVGPIGKKRTI